MEESLAFTLLRLNAQNEFLKRAGVIKDYKVELTTGNYSMSKDGRVKHDFIINQMIVPVTPVVELNFSFTIDKEKVGVYDDLKKVYKSECSRRGSRSGLSFAKTQYEYNGKYE